ncbi:MAG: flavin reductase family protein [Propionibacteriaceae bacterium]|nr:flavin reductase family protein [Propionibacteriaceae bacterium]
MSELRDDLVERDAAAGGLRRAMANFATGVTVVTVTDGGVHYAMTCNSFTSISLDPPLVMVSASQKGRFHDHFLAVDHWSVSVLACGQGAIATHFANPHRDRPRQFEGIDHKLSERTGSPLIGGALAWLECRTTQVVPAGDHSIVLGSVLGAAVRDATEASPLTYFRGQFVDLPRE